MKCICTSEGSGCTNRCDRGQLPPIPAVKVTIPATTASGLVDGEMVERAMKAGEEYWNSPDQVASCDECDGTGKVPVGDSQDWCGTCSGGVINTGTEEGAMRAALEAAICREVTKS